MRLLTRWGLYLLLPPMLWFLISVFGSPASDYPGTTMALWLFFAPALVSSLIPVCVRAAMYTDGEWGNGAGLAVFQLTFVVHVVCFWGISKILGNEWMFQCSMLIAFVHSVTNAVHSLIDSKKRETLAAEKTEGMANGFTVKSR